MGITSFSLRMRADYRIFDSPFMGLRRAHRTSAAKQFAAYLAH